MLFVQPLANYTRTKVLMSNLKQTMLMSDRRWPVTVDVRAREH
jgi:hypothetical protein